MYDDHTFLAAEHPDAVVELEALESSLSPIAAPPVAPANDGFQLPRRLWLSMFTCYAIFFGFIAIATGGSGAARFAIVVSALYTLVYFGVARIGARQAGPEVPSPLERGRALMTWTGPMEPRAVYAQILIVPAVIAFFAIGIAILGPFAA